MRRKVFARCVRSMIEGLESRVLFNNVAVGTGGSAIFGIVQTDAGAPIAGATVYIDLNHDHTLDANDPSVVTDATGAFGFTQIANGQYWLEVVAQPGSQQDAPGYVPVSLMGAANSQNIIIGESTSTGISGLLFYDLNENGVYEPPMESPLVGDTVYLDTNGNGQLDPGEESTVTDNNGLFNLPAAPGIYEVRVVPRPGFHQDQPGVVTVTVGNSDQVIANIGETNLTVISGNVFLDANGNGILDPGETGVANETVDLTQDGITVASGLTDVNGNYVINELPGGLYQITVASNNGDVEDGLGYIDVTLVQGVDQTVNIGEGQPASISGTVFDDKNGNGIPDPGELGQPGQTVYVDINNNGAFDQAGALDPNGMPLPLAEPNAVTDVNGNFTIGNLGPGTYSLRLVPPQGAVPTNPLSLSYTLTIGSGQTLTGENFGYKTPDLTISTVHFPLVPIFGNINQNVTYRITNVGSLPAIGTATIDIFVNTTSTFDMNTAVLVGSTGNLTINLKPGKSKVFKISFAYPTTLATGLYYATAQVSSTVPDVDTTNNNTATIGPVSVTQPLLDLGLVYASQPVAQVAPGNSTVLNLLVTNNGNVTTTSPLTFRVYISATSVLEPSDLVAQSYYLTKIKIKPGQSKLFKLVLFSPGANLGPRYPIVYVDSSDPLGETNLANNVATPITTTLFF